MSFKLFTSKGETQTLDTRSVLMGCCKEEEAGKNQRQKEKGRSKVTEVDNKDGRTAFKSDFVDLGMIFFYFT